jgi:hypothetical protein
MLASGTKCGTRLPHDATWQYGQHPLAAQVDLDEERRGSLSATSYALR